MWKRYLTAFVCLSCIPVVAGLGLAQPPVTEPAQPAPVASPTTAAPTPENAQDNPPPFWVNGSFMLWWVQDGPIANPLLTTGSTGTIGAADTGILFGAGASNLDYGVMPGLSLNAGIWLNEANTLGLDANFFVLMRQSNNFSASSGITDLFVPFTNFPAGDQAPLLLASPANFQAVSDTSFLGSELNLVRNFFRNERLRANWIAGFRYVDLTETIDITTTNSVLGAGTFTFDSFRTHNRFYGGQLGGKIEYQAGRFSIAGLGKLGIGSSEENVEIDGSVLTVPGGIFSTVPPLVGIQGANFGSFSQNRFALVPEVQVNLGYQVSDNLRIFAGYDYIYWSNVVRPGNQIDTRNDNVNPPPGGAPIALMRTSSFWAQGLNFGLEYSF